MITVTIGSSRRSIDDVSESWIADQIARRKADGQTVCVRVEIQTPLVNVTLATPGCAGSGGGGRMPTAAEQRVFELWDKLHLKSSGFAPGNVIAFLKQVARYI
jgi:hypothetical protein